MDIQVSQSRLDAGISRLFAQSSIEILPKAAAWIQSGECPLVSGTKLYIAYTSSSMEEIVNAAAIVRANDLVPVPHIPARKFANEPQFRAFMEALSARASVDQVLLIAGDSTRPAGPFESVIDIMRTGLLEEHGIRTVGVAGHPEGHPFITADIQRRALLEKCEYASKAGLGIYVATQFLFDTQKLFDWHDTFMTRVAPGVPVDVGLPGLAKMTTLLRFAKDCGVSTSFGMFTRHATRAIKLATSYSPEEAVIDMIEATVRTGGSPFRAVHLYPFGSLEKTTEWLVALQSGRFRGDTNRRRIDIL